MHYSRCQLFIGNHEFPPKGNAKEPRVVPCVFLTFMYHAPAPTDVLGCLRRVWAPRSPTGCPRTIAMSGTASPPPRPRDFRRRPTRQTECESHGPRWRSRSEPNVSHAFYQPLIIPSVLIYSSYAIRHDRRGGHGHHIQAVCPPLHPQGARPRTGIRKRLHPIAFQPAGTLVRCLRPCRGAPAQGALEPARQGEEAGTLAGKTRVATDAAVGLCPCGDEGAQGPHAGGGAGRGDVEVEPEAGGRPSR